MNYEEMTVKNAEDVSTLKVEVSNLKDTVSELKENVKVLSSIEQAIVKISTLLENQTQSLSNMNKKIDSTDQKIENLENKFMEQKLENSIPTSLIIKRVIYVILGLGAIYGIIHIKDVLGLININM